MSLEDDFDLHLEAFMDEVAAGRALNKTKRRFGFALDSVLVTEPAVEGDYSTVLPIAKNVQLVRELKESGTMGRVSDGAPHTRAQPHRSPRASPPPQATTSSSRRRG